MPCRLFVSPLLLLLLLLLILSKRGPLPGLPIQLLALIAFFTTTCLAQRHVSAKQEHLGNAFPAPSMKKARPRPGRERICFGRSSVSVKTKCHAEALLGCCELARFLSLLPALSAGLAMFPPASSRRPCHRNRLSWCRMGKGWHRFTCVFGH
ncbi:hypothetical protein V8C35DRAFT_304238 [Trichoderma chlorosporum]